MRAYHNSRFSEYRSPFGAALLGSTVKLSLDVWDDPDCTCALRTWIDGEGETLIPMEAHEYIAGYEDALAREKGISIHDHWVGGDPCEEPDEGNRLRFTCELPLNMLGNVWYCFMIDGSDGSWHSYGPRDGRTGGVGQLRDDMPPSYQITVYHNRSVTPDWFKQAKVYQIFPDRYKRGKNWRDRAEEVLSQPRHGIQRRLVEDWNAPVYYERSEHGRVIRWDFYGGNLEGIREELPHIAGEGYTAIYLNPIFQASSNHRYDTADYLQIDPLLGTNEDFTRLCNDAAELGISIILDGVFNHTGADSRYFNKFGNYPELGAWQSKDSPYFSWYLLSDEGTYACWWGVDDLPDTDKSNPHWQRFIYGFGGVVETWLERGARGWRLDVADELNDSFIAGIKEAETRVKPDALLLGEVWEDASNKIAYGEMRHYLNGDELDSAMNYPFREALLHYLVGHWPASEMAERMASIRENYPDPAYYTTLNLLGSHDRARLFTLLGGAPDPDSLDDEAKRRYRLNDQQKGIAKGKLWLAALVQMCSPGVPCVYYGDDAAMEGYTDPYNRAPYAWDAVDQDAKTIYRNAMALRDRLPVLVDGDFEPFSAGAEVYGFWRYGKGEREGQNVCVLVNRSMYDTYEVKVPRKGLLVDELISGQTISFEETDKGDVATVRLWPFGSAVLYFRDEKSLCRLPERGSGIICHITSLPSNEDVAFSLEHKTEKHPGTLGLSAKRFVDFLESTGQSYWQVLPVTPTDFYGSPYAGSSAFAGNPALIDTGGSTLEELFAQFTPNDEYLAFREENASWLRPYALFMAIKDTVGESVAWQDWPDEYRTYYPELTEREELQQRALYHSFCQFLFQKQWMELRAYANEHGVKIIGDIPIYVSGDSCDTWSQPTLFELGEGGRSSQVAGTPPDQFASNGQIWGNPTYNWRAVKEQGYEWWLGRLGRAFALYDYVRMDHFLGFEHYYSIPRGGSAYDGSWLPGPGIELFKKAYDRFGPLPIIAEDLGSITPAIRALVATCGFPAMDVLEFADYDVRNGYQAKTRKVTYTSTHDTDTLLGWVETSFYPQLKDARARGWKPVNVGPMTKKSDPDEDESTAEAHRDLHWVQAAENKALEEFETEARRLSYRLMCSALNSPADLVMMPLQDVLFLGSDARMNVPGVAEGNWQWQSDWERIDSIVPLLRQMVEKADR